MMLPNWVMGLIRRPYQAALRRGIPDALDLMVVCAEAGLGLELAVERVAQEMKQSNRPVGVEFSLLMHEMRIYPDRRIALTNLAERTGQNALKRLAATVMQTLKYGTPLSQGLRTLAAEMRNERMIQFEERAGKLPALLVMPMMLFILPCLFIIIMGKPASQLMGVFASHAPLTYGCRRPHCARQGRTSPSAARSPSSSRDRCTLPVAAYSIPRFVLSRCERAGCVLHRCQRVQRLPRPSLQHQRQREIVSCCRIIGRGRQHLLIDRLRRRVLPQQVERHALVNQRPHIPRIGCQYLVQFGDRSCRPSGHEIDQRQRP